MRIVCGTNPSGSPVITCAQEQVLTTQALSKHLRVTKQKDRQNLDVKMRRIWTMIERQNKAGYKLSVLSFQKCNYVF